MILHTFEDDGPVPVDIANGAGIGTNRNATGSITISIQPSDPATRYDFHALADQPFVIVFPAGDAFLDGSGAEGNVTLLSRGSTLAAVHSGPGVWTGVLQGQAAIE